jgi:hypothetical protein
MGAEVQPAARRSWVLRALGERRGGDEDPWLCGPGFRRVCLYRGMVEGELSRDTGTVKRPAPRGSVRVSSGHVRTRKQRAADRLPYQRSFGLIRW